MKLFVTSVITVELASDYYKGVSSQKLDREQCCKPFQ